MPCNTAASVSLHASSASFALYEHGYTGVCSWSTSIGKGELYPPQNEYSYCNERVSAMAEKSHVCICCSFAMWHTKSVRCSVRQSMKHRCSASAASAPFTREPRGAEDEEAAAPATCSSADAHSRCTIALALCCTRRTRSEIYDKSE